VKEVRYFTAEIIWLFSFLLSGVFKLISEQTMHAVHTVLTGKMKYTLIRIYNNTMHIIYLVLIL
jgi:hypothetical protein